MKSRNTNIHKKRKMRETSQKTTKSTWQTESQTHTHKKNWRQSNQKTKHKMAVLGPHLSISTLNVNGLNSPIKNIEWLNGLKNKIQLYGVSMRLTPALKTNIGSK